MKRWINVLFGLALAGLMLAGCSDDKSSTVTPPTTETGQLELIDIGTLVEQTAPPVFTTPTGAPATIDSAWMYGQSPLLEKVFGSTEPQSLYANVNDFRRSIEIIEHTAEVNADGAILPGTYVDSHLVDMGDEQMMMHFTAVVTTLDAPTAIPAVAQEVIGTTLNLGYLITISVDEFPTGTAQIGIAVNDSEQTLLQFDSGMDDPTDSSSRLIYASLDPRDSSYSFKGVGYCMHADGDMFTYAFNIASEASSEFAYRQSYFSNGTPGMTFLHTVIGGGDRDNEFALRYRLFTPADTTVCDSTHMLDQVFGPNYSEGSGLIADYSNYLSEELIYLYDVIPEAMLPSPWGD